MVTESCMVSLCVCVCVCVDLRRRFERAPVSATVELGSPAQLQCLPPIGAPQPTVSQSDSDSVSQLPGSSCCEFVAQLQQLHDTSVQHRAALLFA